MASPRKRRQLKLARSQRIARAAEAKPEPKVEKNEPVAPPQDPAPALVPEPEVNCDTCGKVLELKEDGCPACVEPAPEPEKSSTRKKRTRRTRKTTKKSEPAPSEEATAEEPAREGSTS